MSEDSRADRWEKALAQLRKWSADPSQLEDEGVIAPTRETISRAYLAAVTARDNGVPAPLRVVPDGEGGIVFECADGSEMFVDKLVNGGSMPNEKQILAPCPFPGCGREPRYAPKSKIWLCDNYHGQREANHVVYGPADDPTGAGRNAAYGSDVHPDSTSLAWVKLPDGSLECEHKLFKVMRSETFAYPRYVLSVADQTLSREYHSYEEAKGDAQAIWNAVRAAGSRWNNVLHAGVDLAVGEDKTVITCHHEETTTPSAIPRLDIYAMAVAQGINIDPEEVVTYAKALMAAVDKEQGDANATK